MHKHVDKENDLTRIILQVQCHKYVHTYYTHQIFFPFFCGNYKLKTQKNLQCMQHVIQCRTYRSATKKKGVVDIIKIFNVQCFMIYYHNFIGKISQFIFFWGKNFKHFSIQFFNEKKIVNPSLSHNYSNSLAPFDY